ncbi:MAG: Uma2 family endonuclease [Thiolinea sp.]
MEDKSRYHNLLAGYLAAQLFNHLRDTCCQVFQSDMKFAIETLGDTRFYYPNVQVSCEDEADTYVNKAPCLIIEVLSVSTVQKDRAEKLSGYRLIPALQEYVLCSQDSPYLEIYRRRSEWKMEYFTTG